MVRISFVFVAWLAMASTGIAQPADIAAVLKSNAIPSVSFVSIRHGKIVAAKTWGEQSPGVPATAETLYNIASLTKPLTAEIILRMASAGALGLDEAMSPTFVDPDIAGDPRNLLLTPRLALTHQAGFPNWRRTEALRFLRDPGTGYNYSGEGYQYVAHFAEKKADSGFESLADRYLLVPDGLKRTSYVGQPWFEGHVALPTGADGVAQPPHIVANFLAADLVYTTAGDYAQFLLSVLRDKDVTATIAKDRMRVQRSQKDTDCAGEKAKTCPTDVGPGLGWQVLAFPGHTILMHTGKDVGVFTLAYLDKTTGDGAVILTNGENGARIVLPLLEQSAAYPAFLAYLRDRAD